jgi:ferrochelatase
MTKANRHCYRAQCYATSRQLAARLGLQQGQWSVSFQSRLGRTPWIRPYTDIVLPELAKRGVKRLLVFCPAFVADCLETLEEVAIRGRDQFRAEGGEDLQLVPSLNSSEPWVEALATMVQRSAGTSLAADSMSLRIVH